jgi:hypothetical protein
MSRMGMWCSVLAAGALPLVCAAQQAAAPVQPPLPTWADKVTVKGDLRYRFESIDQEGKPSRERERIRARLGADAKVNDSVKAGIELSTGQKDPVSDNQTLGDGENKKDMNLNLAYIDWTLRPDSASLNLVAGKIKNPFLGVSDLIWDGDLTFDGAALKGRTAAGPIDLFANAGSVVFQERAADSDSRLLAGQLGAKARFTDEVSLLVGGSYYDYDNMAGFDVLDWEGKNNAYGNSTVRGSIVKGVTNSAYAADYALAQGFAQLTYWIPTLKMPLNLYADYVVNGDASADDTGYLYGTSLGKAKNPGTYELGYAYHKLEKDAVVGAFTDSDRTGGGTDGRGHKVFGRYQLMQNLQFGVAFFSTERNLAKPTDYERLQIDLVASF